MARNLKVLVLGSGAIGTTAAWYLAKDGHAVTVVDRQPDPAMWRWGLSMLAHCNARSE